MRALLWTGTVFNLVLFLPALYFVALSLPALGMTDSPPYLTLLFFSALPALCIVSPGLAWRQFDRFRNEAAILLILVPITLAGVLAYFLFLG